MVLVPAKATRPTTAISFNSIFYAAILCLRWFTCG